MDETLFPPVDPTRTAFDLPVREVTVLEDRAQVVRRGTVRIPAGPSRAYVASVAPVLQDVSVRAEAKGARVADARPRRALRIRRADKPEAIRALDEEIRSLLERLREIEDSRGRKDARYGKVLDMLHKGVVEIPGDAAWGIIDSEGWRTTFDALFDRARSLQKSGVEQFFAQKEAAEALANAVARRLSADRPDQHLTAWIELDLIAETEIDADITLAYTVPNALWRPAHRAQLAGDKLLWTGQGAVWQRTGEDWKDVDLILSTARSSLGTEPPLLSDDRLAAQRRVDEVVVEAREVHVQTASVQGGAVPSTVELPGVEDGGEIRMLRAESKVTVPSDGRPVFVPLFTFSAAAEVTFVLFPEREERVLYRVVAKNEGRAPVLAGPVELVKDSGVVGQTEVLFVAPDERFELGFGPDDNVRVRRESREVSAKADPVDKWRRKVTQVWIYLSNLSDEPRAVQITERVPVSEIAHVKVEIIQDRTSIKVTPDENGFCKMDVVLKPHEQRRIDLGWQLATAPDVKGL